MRSSDRSCTESTEVVAAKGFTLVHEVVTTVAVGESVVGWTAREVTARLAASVA